MTAQKNSTSTNGNPRLFNWSTGQTGLASDPDRRNYLTVTYDGEWDDLRYILSYIVDKVDLEDMDPHFGDDLT